MSRLAADVHVWTKRVVPGIALDRLELALDDGERLRARRFLREPDRCSYVTAHWLLRQALSWAEPSVEPLAWRLRKTEHGKPELADGRSGIRLSLSHCPRYVAVSLADDIDCGIDVESTRPAGELRPLAASVLSARGARPRSAPPRTTTTGCACFSVAGRSRRRTPRRSASGSGCPSTSWTSGSAARLSCTR